MKNLNLNKDLSLLLFLSTLMLAWNCDKKSSTSSNKATKLKTKEIETQTEAASYLAGVRKAVSYLRAASAKLKAAGSAKIAATVGVGALAIRTYGPDALSYLTGTAEAVETTALTLIEKAAPRVKETVYNSSLALIEQGTGTGVLGARALRTVVLGTGALVRTIARKVRGEKNQKTIVRN